MVWRADCTQALSKCHSGSAWPTNCVLYVERFQRQQIGLWHLWSGDWKLSGRQTHFPQRKRMPIYQQFLGGPWHNPEHVPGGTLYWQRPMEGVLGNPEESDATENALFPEKGWCEWLKTIWTITTTEVCSEILWGLTPMVIYILKTAV